MPAMLNLGLFNIPQGIMPFPMNTNAFMASFFVLAFIVVLVWGILFHLSTVIEFANTMCDIAKTVVVGMESLLKRHIPAGTKVLDTHDDEQIGRDQRALGTAAITTGKVGWGTHVKSRFGIRGRRTQEMQSGQVEQV